MNRILWLFLLVTRLRDRLKCPICSAVGTYKLHAPGNGRPFRWMCKWCGYYKGPEGTGQLCCPSPSFGCWIFKTDEKGYKGRTPRELVHDGAREDLARAAMAQSPEEFAKLLDEKAYEPWPWRG